MGDRLREQGRCLYEILGVARDSTQEEIRSSYKKLALQRHPDKLVSAGVPETEATAAFQSLLNAYQILSDPRERSWYDSHRSQILFSDISQSRSSARKLLDVSDLLPFFSNSAFVGFSDSPKGFYGVYGDVFSKIHAQEIDFARELGFDLDLVGNAPLIGKSDSPYVQVSAFYSFWQGFSTVLDFSWVDPWNSSDGLPSRKARRMMEDENRKARKKARREFNDTVRGLAEFVKKRDKRVIEMQLKKTLEEERRRAEEKEKKKEELRKKMERARSYQEPEWARNKEEEIADDVSEEEDNGKKDNELYCVVCSKKFKSDKQWKNHEQSKKHREKLAQLRASFSAEDVLKVDETTIDAKSDEVHADDFGSNEQAGDNVDDLCDKFEDCLNTEEDLLEDQQNESKIFFADSGNGNERIHASAVNNGLKESDATLGSDEEASILESMVFGHKSGKGAPACQFDSSSSQKDVNDSNGESFMEYDTRKTTRRNRRSRNTCATKLNAGTEAAEDGQENASDANAHDVLVEKDEVDDISPLNESLGNSADKTRSKISRDEATDKYGKSSKQSALRKGVGDGDGDGDANAKSKGSTKGKKKNAASKTCSLTCETCGEKFESRNKLHVHLGDTGHAVLKFR